MKVYTLRFIGTDKFASISISCFGNDAADNCGSYSATLGKYGDTIWTTVNKDIAEKVCRNNIPWYNSDVEEPSNDYVGELEVVEITI